jgi:hypothetical protein
MAGALISLFSLIAYYTWSVREPSGEGESLSFWLNELRSDDPERQQNARRVVSGMGEGTLRWLVDKLDREDSYIRKAVSSRGIRIGRAGTGVARVVLPSGDYERAMAATALGTMGRSAENAIPSLTRAAKDPSLIVAGRSQAALIQIRNETPPYPVGTPTTLIELVGFIKAASVLFALGTNIAPLEIQMAQGLRSARLSAQYDLVQFFSVEKLEPSVIWPLLILCLGDPAFEEPVRANALNAVMVQFNNPLLTGALKARLRGPLIGCLSDTNRNVRLNVSMVLSHCFAVDASFLPAPLLKQLQNDPDLRDWAAEIQKRAVPFQQ